MGQQRPKLILKTLAYEKVYYRIHIDTHGCSQQL